ncbi:MAG: hypothetical protein WB493_18175 [Anaeromyxobacteraceae bacterium]
MRVIRWIVSMLVFCLPGAMVLAMAGGRGQRLLGWALVVLAAPCAFLAGRSGDAYLVVLPGGLERVDGWGSRTLMRWKEVWSVSLGAVAYPRTTYVSQRTLSVRGVASGKKTRFRVQVDVPGIGDLAAAILANAPASTLAQEPDAAEALAAIAAVTGRPMPALDERRAQS